MTDVENVRVSQTWDEYSKYWKYNVKWLFPGLIDEFEKKVGCLLFQLRKFGMRLW